jgi:hypothetical protein
MSKPTEAGMARFTALLEELSSELDVVKASMFGMPGIKRRGGKAFCGLYGDDMIFKLADADHERALGLTGAHLFEPMAGRPMKAWVEVPPEHESQYGDLARAAEAGLGP